MGRPCCNLEAAKHKKPCVGSSFYPSVRESMWQDWDGRCHGSLRFPFSHHQSLMCYQDPFWEEDRNVWVHLTLWRLASLFPLPLWELSWLVGNAGAYMAAASLIGRWDSALYSAPKSQQCQNLAIDRLEGTYCVWRNLFGSSHEKQDESSEFHGWFMFSWKSTGDTHPLLFPE